MMTRGNRPRPAVFRALGHREVASELWTDGIRWTRLEIFKHDSWAATALYGAGSRRIVVKFNRLERISIVPMAWLGGWLATREGRAYERLRGVRGVPSACGPVKVAGKVLGNAFAHEYVEGHPLGKEECPGPAFFDALEVLLRTMHARRMVYLDLNKRENVIVTEVGEPLLVDFQIHLTFPAWMVERGPGRWIFRQFQAGDFYHWSKLRACHTLGPEAVHGLRVPWSSRLWRMIYVHPVQWVRRRILVALGIRAGEGLASSELMPEKAVRLTRERQEDDAKTD